VQEMMTWILIGKNLKKLSAVGENCDKSALEVEILRIFRLRIGTTKEAETDDSGLITVYEYTNALSLEGTQFVFQAPKRSVMFIQSIDTDQDRALSDFNAGKKCKSTVIV